MFSSVKNSLVFGFINARIQEGSLEQQSNPSNGDNFCLGTCLRELFNNGSFGFLFMVIIFLYHLLNLSRYVVLYNL